MMATLALIAGPLASSPAQAISGSEFDAGNIISDQRFFDSSAMSIQDVQNFLASQEPTCGGNPNPCLKNYYGLSSNRADAGAGHCTAYASPGYETAATMIWRVAQACRINPQVLLTTLQKEQALITDGFPSDRQYRVAMGFACPDTAPCDTRYYGFFNQLYMAAWQFRQYTLKPAQWNYRVGANTVRFSPNAACGAGYVNIINQATANLYNYTPYQPNGSALANLYGSGDSCGSYGNRNFWRYFYQWFGPPSSPGPRQMADELAYQGGVDGPLGAPTSGILTISDNGGGLGQAFTNGSIYWTPSTGAFAVYGPYRDYYFARSGAAGSMGWPASRVAIVTGGTAQAFTRSSVYSSPAGTFSVDGGIRDRYFASGGATGVLGMPKSDSTCTTGGVCRQQFAAGMIVGSAGTGWQAILEPVLSVWNGQGGVGSSAGLPVSAAVTSADGTGQTFQNGSYYAATGRTAVLVSGAVRDAYFALGGSSSWIGWPVSPATCSATSCEQRFDRASIRTTATAATIYSPEIDSAATSAQLGTPATAVIPYAGGIAQGFRTATVYSSSAGAFVTSGAIRDRYWQLGGATGSAGWPTAAQTCTAAVCSQRFQNASITARGGATVVLASDFLAAYDLQGGRSLFGDPTTERLTISANGGGIGQAFSNGSLFRGTSVGAVFGVSGPVRDYYFGIGGAAGDYGWPASAQVASSDNGGGRAQAFQRGSVYTSSAGTFGTWGPVRDAYWAQGGSSGSLGWPASPVTCTPVLCSQKFQYGKTITWSAGSGAAIR